MALTFRTGLGSRATLHKGLAYSHLEDGDNASAGLRSASGPADGHFLRPERVECCGTIATVKY